jgi:outer membrane murein-binding lipoprotein Lpp
MKGAVKTLFFLSMLMVASAQAKIYMCKDASGKTLSSDRPIPECADRPVREYSNNGSKHKDYAAPLTADQKQALELQQERIKAEQAAAAEQKRTDRALSARYRSEDDIAAARKRDTDLVSIQMTQYKAALHGVEKDLASGLERQQQSTLSPSMQAKQDRLQQKVQDLKKHIKDSETELAQINEKYDLTLRRYREITKTALAP